jgi:hypothetical protein
MLRIVGIQRSENSLEEFVLLQNHSSMRMKLRGHVIMSESYLTHYALDSIYAFTDEELIHPGAFVLLYSGSGINRWAKTKQGSMVYMCYIGSRESRWNVGPGPMHILCTQHTYEERTAPMEELVRR